MELKGEIAQVRSELPSDISRLEVRLAQMESRLIKWMFIFWIGQVGVMLALVAALKLL